MMSLQIATKPTVVTKTIGHIAFYPDGFADFTIGESEILDVQGEAVWPSDVWFKPVTYGVFPKCGYLQQLDGL